MRKQYEKEVVPELQKEFGFKNKMEVPRLTKIVVNTGVPFAIDSKTGNPKPS